MASASADPLDLPASGLAARGSFPLACALGALLVLVQGGGLSAQARPDDAGRAVVSGVVRDTMQRPIALVTLRIEDTEVTAYSDTAGRFRLAGITPGAVRLAVMRIGYQPFALDTTIGPGDTLEIGITLRGIPTLEEIETRADRMTRWTATGFDDRRRTGIGTFVTPARVDSLRHLSTPAKLLRDVSGIDVVCPAGGACRIVPRWTNCLLLIVDGMSYAESEMDEVLWTSQIHAIEVYDRASRVPLRFQNRQPSRGPGGFGGLNRSAGCGAIVVWTKARAP